MPVLNGRSIFGRIAMDDFHKSTFQHAKRLNRNTDAV